MGKSIRIGIIGDRDPTFRPHVATDEAIAHAAAHLSVPVETDWLPTPSLERAGAEKVLQACDGLWASPGSPYRSMEGALVAIRYARERNWPFFAT
jgi:CTP synthase (UTP-ammonia lyase)